MVRRDAGRPRGRPVVDAVLDAVLVELGQFGLANLSVEKVAGRAEVNKTTIYRRWPTREDLIAAALHRAAATIAELPDRGSLREDLLAVAESVAALLARPEGRALARAAIERAPTSGATDRVITVTDSAVPPLVARARERGQWPAGADPGAAMSLLVGAIWHRVLVERAPADPPWLTDLVDLLLRGLNR